MKPLYQPPRKTRRNPLLPLLLIIAVVIGAMWYLSSRAREVPLTTIEADVKADAATR